MDRQSFVTTTIVATIFVTSLAIISPSQFWTAQGQGVTGPISGTLVEGNFTAPDFSGRLNVDQMSDF